MALTSEAATAKFAEIDRQFDEHREARHQMNERWTEAFAHAMQATEETDKAVAIMGERISAVEAMRLDVGEIKAVLKGDTFGNEGIVSKVNWMWRRMLILNAAWGAIVVAVELYRGFAH